MNASPKTAVIALLLAVVCPFPVAADTAILVALPSELDAVHKEIRLVGQPVELTGHRVSSTTSVNDYALATGPLHAWEGNQERFKPDGGWWTTWRYTYDSSLDPGFQVKLLRGANNDRRFVTMPYESMSFVARSRSKALGARAGVGGVITENFNIGEGSATNLGWTRPDHSGQFTRSIQVLQPFYQKLSGVLQ